MVLGVFNCFYFIILFIIEDSIINKIIAYFVSEIILYFTSMMTMLIFISIIITTAISLFLVEVSRLTTQPSVHPPVQCQPRVTRILHAPSNPPPVHSTKPPYHYHQTRSLPPRHQTPLKQLAPRLQPTSGSVWYYHQYPAAPPPPADCYGTMPPAAYVPGYPHLSLLEPIPEMAYQEINGCYYFPPTSERAMSAAAQYGYPQRGKQRKAQRLSSRFATQAGKFHHHANFYVKSSAESVVTHQMGDN